MKSQAVVVRWAVIALVLTEITAGRATAADPLVVRSEDLGIEVAQGASGPERHAAEILEKEIRKRTGRVPATGAGTKHRVVLKVDPASGLKTDGFRLIMTPDRDGRMVVVGQSPCGLVAGVGKLLRTSGYEPGRMMIRPSVLEDGPQMRVRGMYFATHFHNFYHVAPLEEVDRIIEELALWGENQLLVWFDMHHFHGIQDPAAQQHLARLRHFAETAHGIGMKFGLAFLANEGYADSPKPLRSDGRTGRAHYGVELCPSKPEGLALIGRWQAEVLDSFPSVDFAWTWPYDQGGCACDQCKPWGANGYLRASEQLARLFHRRFPQGELWLSTWLLDYQKDEGEYRGLMQYLREQKPAWPAGILAGTHGDWIPEVLLTRPYPERYPLTCFPEISMYQMNPWGSCGANPLPGYCSRLAEKLRGRIVGGWPYSEGIFEDVNKFFWSQFYWRPDRTTDDILAEYATYYFGAGTVNDGVQLLRLLEKTHARDGWRVQNLKEADDAWAVAKDMDARMPSWAKTSWRWRIVYVRAAIDHVLKSQGSESAAAARALKPLTDEIRCLYHVEPETIAILPPSLPTGTPKP